MMVWQFCLCIGFIFLILELLCPFTFFLSLSIGAFLTAIIAVWVTSKFVIIPAFAILSLVSLLIFRPFLAKNNEVKDDTTGVAKYIGQRVKVLKTVTQNSGVITLYGERWEARSDGDEEILEGDDAVIVRNESLVMYVKKVRKENN